MSFMLEKRSSPIPVSIDEGRRSRSPSVGAPPVAPQGPPAQRGLRAFLRRHDARLRWSSWILIAIALVALARALPVERALRALHVWIDSLGVLGPLVYGVVYALAVTVLVPASVLTLAAGAVFGFWTGILVVSFGATGGATLAFLVARYAARERVERHLASNPKFEAVDRAIAREGWRMVGLLRLSPALPFSLSNYLYGLTGVRLGPYVLATAVGTLPGTLLHVSIGAVGGASLAGARSRSTLEWSLLAAGLVATICVTIYVMRVASRAVARRTAAEPEPALRPARPAPRPLWSTSALATTALGLSCAAILCYVEPSYLAGFFGPPPIHPREAYARRASGATFDHRPFSALLAEHVDAEGWVDYAALGEQSERLDAYIDALARADFDGLRRDDKLALLVNAYNAFALRLILDHEDVESIQDISTTQRWKRTWSIGGHETTLWDLEHHELRERFTEPRIHFALCSASAGAPPLRAEAYEGARIDEQLEDQVRRVHASPRWVRFDAELGVLELTRLYEWYREDFLLAAASVPAYVARYVPELRHEDGTVRDAAIAYLPFDWSLNSLASRLADGEALPETDG